MARIQVLLILTWVSLLGLVFSLPALSHAATAGDDLTRHTVRLSLLFWAAALMLMLTLSPSEWAAEGRGRLARCCWSLAWLAYLVHLGVAFHYYHHWSHAAAVRHVRDVSGFGEGIYASHAFTVLWTLDVAYWWLRPQAYAKRSLWVGRVLHGFMAFMVFNATVVYEQGFIRWAGLALFTLLGPLWLRSCLATPKLREEPT
jgi:hypothetical protein